MLGNVKTKEEVLLPSQSRISELKRDHRSNKALTSAYGEGAGMRLRKQKEEEEE